MIKTAQIKKWEGEFGKSYTERNPYTVEDTESLYITRYGTGRIKMNEEFIGNLDRRSRILEVGSNVGAQSLVLQKMGFNNLYSIEIQDRAIEVSKSISKGLNIIKGSALDIPFKDRWFDMVFTSGVLIHIAPQDIKQAIKEIHRCTKRYIWGFEYFAEEHTGIDYRGEKDLLWKADFAQIYLNAFGDLRMIREKKFKYLENDNEDEMFLLEKVSG